MIEGDVSTVPTAVDAREPSPGPGQGRAPLFAAVVVGVVAIVPRLMTVGHYFNADERLWTQRSWAFSEALIHGRPGDMHALEPFEGTVPGIIVVWLGSIARGFWTLGQQVGIVDGHQDFVTSASGFTAGQVMVAVCTSLLLALLTWLVAHWTSVRVAVVTGLVLATAPFWVSLGSVFHTDELVTLFGLSGLVALTWSFGLPAGVVPPRHARRWSVVGACLLTGAVLTKLNGLVFAPAAVGIVVWALTRAVRHRAGPVGRWTACRPVAATCGLMAIVSAAVTVILYPAIVFDFTRQVDSLTAQVRTVGGVHVIYYKGQVVERPGLDFYPVSLAYQTTIWEMILIPVGGIAALVRRRSRPFAVAIAAWAVVPFIVLTRSGMNYARYGLVLLGPATLVAAVALVDGRPWSLRRHGIDRVISMAGVAMFVFALATAPWGGLVYNPILSAYRAPKQVVRVGWGEPVAAAMPIIRRDADALGLDCSDVTVAGFSFVPIADVNCQPTQRVASADADYRVVGLATRLVRPGTMGRLKKNFEYVGTAHIYGQPIVEVWRRVGVAPGP